LSFLTFFRNWGDRTKGVAQEVTLQLEARQHIKKKERKKMEIMTEKDRHVIKRKRKKN
jgi:hypothetical protein